MFEKFFLKSKTIWGVIIMLLTNLAPFAGIGFTAEDAAALNAAFEMFGNAIGAVLVVWGRVSAASNLRFNPFGKMGM